MPPNMKAKFIVLLIAEVLCLAFLLELISTPFTLKVQRVLFGLALILITSLLWWTAVRVRYPVRPGSAHPPVQRTGASRLAQRQIERHRRLAPVADLQVRRRTEYRTICQRNTDS